MFVCIFAVVARMHETLIIDKIISANVSKSITVKSLYINTPITMLPTHTYIYIYVYTIHSIYYVLYTMYNM